jgi:MYXO-CTERM domain-containing protein
MSGAIPNSPLRPDDSEAVCGTVNLSTISVQFLYFAPGDPSTAAVDKAVAITVDTVGPPPPSGLNALPGDTRIQVSWVNISGGNPDAGATGGLTELTGVKVYCDVAGAAAPSDGGTSNPPVCRQVEVEAGRDDAGTPITRTVEVCNDGGTAEGGTTTPPAAGCTSPNLTSSDGTKIFPTAAFNAKYECGNLTGNAGTSVNATSVGGKPLVNGTLYAVAVANTDKFGNVGELSSPICMTPEITTDFWDDYRKAGGRAGGGCATSESPASSIAVGALGAGALALTFARRKRRRARTRSSGRAKAEEKDEQKRNDAR